MGMEDERNEANRQLAIASARTTLQTACQTVAAAESAVREAEGRLEQARWNAYAARLVLRHLGIGADKE